MPKTNLLKGFAAPDPRTIANDADGCGREQLPTVRANPLKPRIGTDADGEDANLPSQSAPEKYVGGHSYEDGSCRRCRTPPEWCRARHLTCAGVRFYPNEVPTNRAHYQVWPN